MIEKHTLAGILLKLERLRQDKGQKEVCSGICVPSYLSKIEHGTVCADEKILAELFARLGIFYEKDQAVLEKLGKLIEKYFYCRQYYLDTRDVYEKLQEQERTLMYSRYAVDWLLICAFEQAAPRDIMDRLDALKEHMEPRQLAYYKLLCAQEEKNAERAVHLSREACDVLNNSYAMLMLCVAYFRQGNYSEIHRMEQRVVAAAVEEGNTYQLADFCFMNGNAYACLNMEEMMMVYFERGIRLLQNTAWKRELAGVYYNIGATYISLRKYDPALEYLEMAEQEDTGHQFQIPIFHKKAIVFLRTGRKDEGKKILAEMKNLLLKKTATSAVDWLIYEEAEMEAEEGFLNNPEYLKLLEKLIRAIKEELHFGYLYFYREVIVEACKRQRRYRQALEFEQEISSGIVK
nr:XRE family transcriptional regulator [uncultured Marvinbryantia sp.]